MGEVTVQRKPPNEDLISAAILLLGLIVIGFLLILIIRVQRGLLGIVLAGLAVFLLVYWLRELRKTVKEEWLAVPVQQQVEWAYDLIDRDSELILVAEVPGPEDQVKVKLEGRVLEIAGGHGFHKRVKLPRNVEKPETTYNYGVLEVRLKKK
ncbi:Hsp20/alpha crystallin family protein [Candidatus Hecatella orcuttiae]|uniref:Hsp20/alpha crystallin family protein n=1 Tax=Candidatus Hecatella orcuttiae TaxID=1935119 RepID=UPI002867C997|nr:Hsp20/alpha crystallin family protein [Candidatus Hecatella orcuttiae]